MAVPLRRPRPKLADISCTKIQFSPGDRILCRTYRKLEKDEECRLRKAITKWAGCDVEVLIYNATELDIEVEKPNDRLWKPNKG